MQNVRNATLMKSTRFFVAALAALSLGTGAATQGQSSAGRDQLTADVLKGLEFRSIGPAISTGRVQDIAIDPKSPSTWYVATFGVNGVFDPQRKLEALRGSYAEFLRERGDRLPADECPRAVSPRCRRRANRMERTAQTPPR